MNISIVGQISNKKTGLGKAIDDFIVYAGNSPKIKSIEQIDITNNKLILLHLKKIIFSNCDFFYFTPSGSIAGNLRDCLLLLAMILKKKKIINHFHNSSFGSVISSNIILSLLNKFIYKFVDRIILLGEKQKDMFLTLKVEEKKFFIIRNGIDNNIFISKTALVRKWECPIRNIVFFSNMIPDKGYDVVLDVARIMRNKKEYHFYFSGIFFDDELKSQFLEKISNFDNVTYIPGVYGKDKVEFLHKAHFFILPSKYKDETLPISMLEAMASGAYIIISNVGVVSEVVSETTSRLIDMSSKNIKGDIVNYILALDKIRFDSDLLDIKARYSLEKIQEEILNTVLNS